MKTFDNTIAPMKNVDAFQSFHSDWRDLPDNYLTSDLQLRSIPSMIAYHIIKQAQIDIIRQPVLLVGSDALNQPALENFLKGYLLDSSLLHCFSSLSDAATLQEARSYNPQAIFTCLNKPEQLLVSAFPSTALFVDFGYGLVKEKVKGDLKLGLDCYNHPGLITTVPGGTGPLIRPALLRNLYVSWKRKVTQ